MNDRERLLLFVAVIFLPAVILLNKGTFGDILFTVLGALALIVVLAVIIAAAGFARSNQKPWESGWLPNTWRKWFGLDR